MKKRLLFAGIAFFALAAVLFFSNRGKKNDTIATTGIVEGTEVNLSSKISGRISEFCCKEGDKVIAGHPVARLESEDLKASVEQAEAGVMKAIADISSAEAAVKNSAATLRSSEADIKTAEAEVKIAGSKKQETERQMHRADLLYTNEYISNADVELAMTSYDSALASYNASESRLKAAVSKKEAATAQLHAAESLLTSARAGLREALAAKKFQEARFRDTEINTPISGTVVFRGMEAGEVVSPGSSILTIVDLDDLWVRIDLEETFISHVKIGDKAIIKINGFPDISFKGSLAEIGKEADFATQRDVTRGRQDIKTFRVKIKTDDKTGTLKPGMTVMVEIPGKG